MGAEFSRNAVALQSPERVFRSLWQNWETSEAAELPGLSPEVVSQIERLFNRFTQKEEEEEQSRAQDRQLTENDANVVAVDAKEFIEQCRLTKQECVLGALRAKVSQ